MNLPNSLVRVATRALTTVKKYSPQIMMAVGAATSVAAVVEAVKQTPKAMDILDEHKDERDKIQEARDNYPEEYSEQEYKKELAALYIRTGSKLGKTYLMPIIMEATSLLCFFNAHRIVSNRNKQLAAALATMTDAYNNYRNKMIEELGEDKEEQIRMGLEKEKRTIEVVDESTGKVKKSTNQIDIFDAETSKLGPWDILWTESDPLYDQSEELNDLTITSIQNKFTTFLYDNHILDSIPLTRITQKFLGENKAYTYENHLINGYTQKNHDRAVLITSRNVEVRYKDEDGNYRYEVGRILTFNGDGDITR